MNISTIQGTGDKKILIITGVHGNELTSVYAGILVQHEISSNLEKYQNLFGGLKIIGAANIRSIREVSAEITRSDGKNMNRLFSTDPSEGEVVTEIEKSIMESDIVIDIHSSANCTEFISIDRNENANSYVEFCLKNRIKYLQRYCYNETVKNFAIKLDKIAFTLELNKLDVIDTVSAVAGSSIVLDIIRNIAGFESKKEEPKYNDYYGVSHYSEGLLLPLMNVGADVVADNIIARLVGAKKNDIDYVIKAPVDGTIICGFDKGYIRSGEDICWIQPIDQIKESKKMNESRHHSCCPDCGTEAIIKTSTTEMQCGGCGWAGKIWQLVPKK